MTEDMKQLCVDQRTYTEHPQDGKPRYLIREAQPEGRVGKQVADVNPFLPDAAVKARYLAAASNACIGFPVEALEEGEGIVWEMYAALQDILSSVRCSGDGCERPALEDIAETAQGVLKKVRKCKWCGGLFWVEHRDQSFCSDQCRRAQVNVSQ